MTPFILNPLPKEHRESSECPPMPEGDLPHGHHGPRLEITDIGGYSASTRTGNWRWCATCRNWQKGVAIIGAMMCPKCHRLWDDPLPPVDTASAVRDGLYVSREARERAFSEADKDGHCERSGFVLEEGQR